MATDSDVGKVLFDSFVNFPVPLALADCDGRIQLVNAEYAKCFGAATPDMASLAAAGPNTEVTVPRPAGASALRQELRGRAVRVGQHILLVFSRALDGTGYQQLETLQHRISELENLISTDYLTGTWNRTHLDRVIAVELTRGVASRQPVTLIMFDIDHFKLINDTHGHATGDRILREVVERVQQRLRSSDLLFRWGGEEFVVLAPSTGYRTAELLAERLRLAVAARSFGEVGKVTISLGVAEHIAGETAKVWFDRLDAALYGAKSEGRDRVVVDRRGDSDAWAAEQGKVALRLVWQEGYESGQPTIDAEHRELFRLANELIDAGVNAGLDGARARAALDTLLAHITTHFADEEAILARAQYGDLENHRLAHARLLRRARELDARVRRGEAGIGAIVEYLAQDVVARHIFAVDRAFFPLFSPSLDHTVIPPRRHAAG